MEHKLRDNDHVICSSMEERNNLLTLLHQSGKIPLYRSVIPEMYNEGDYEEYPNVYYSEVDGFISVKRNIQGNTLTRREFLRAAGVINKPQGDSFIKFHFI